MKLFSSQLLQSKTLQSRLLKSISVFTLSLFLLFSATTLFIAYALEDALFKEQLQLASEKLNTDEPLPAHITLVSDITELKPTSIEQLLYLEFTNSDQAGEFSVDGKHFHYLTTEQGVLVLDTSEAGIINRAIDDILAILFFVLIPAMLLALWVARITAIHALKPFHQLSQLFVNHQNAEVMRLENLDHIHEQDVKHIALELMQALQQKAQLLEQQIAFNQGMAHELRTPLQVMTHSVEILSHSHEHLNNVTSFTRLNKSIQRMHRLCDGLLWLTSQQEFGKSTPVSQMLEASLTAFKDVIETHSIDVSIDTNANLQLGLPESVFELIVFNLLNNVVHHGHLTQGSTRWQIEISEQGIRFSNSIEQANEDIRDEERFGVGLKLVSMLAERFGYEAEISTKNHGFSFAIKVPQ